MKRIAALDIKRIAVLLSLWSWALAQEGWNPLWGVYLLPIKVPAPRGCTVELEGSILNYLSYAKGDWGEIENDAEELRISAGVYASTEWGQFGIGVPLRLYWGGFLDYALNPYHAWLGLPTSPAGPPRTIIAVTDAADNSRRIISPQLGLGDPVLSWSLGGPEGWWGRASLGVPLGDPGRFMGSGGWRGSLTVGLQQPDWGGALHTLVPFGSQALFAGLGQQPTLGAWLWSRLPWELPGRLELQASTSPVALGGSFARTLVALRYVWGGFSLAEDITPALPDVVIGYAGWFGCS
jgi:hypothetical protein